MIKKLSIMLVMSLLLGMLNVSLYIQQVPASLDYIYITAAGPVAPPTAPISWVLPKVYHFISDITQYDGVVVQRSDIVVDGQEHTLTGQGSLCGFYVEANQVRIRNTHIDNWEKGIDVYEKRNCLFSRNTITNNYMGISFSANLISGHLPCKENYVCENTIQDNTYGVSLVGNCYDNAFFHNNFVDNEQHALVGSTESSWDGGYPSGGNYWSGHSCTGNPSDGSQPYSINDDNIDHYPFQDPNSGWEPSSAVGGFSIPVDKFALLAPYIALVATVVAVIVGTVYAKKRWFGKVCCSVTLNNART